jgi:hypothetical protein
VNTVNTILENVEEILEGIEPVDADLPVYDLPDYLPRMEVHQSGPGC